MPPGIGVEGTDIKTLCPPNAAIGVAGTDIKTLLGVAGTDISTECTDSSFGVAGTL